MSNSVRFFKKKAQFEDPSKILLDCSPITNMKVHKKTSHHVAHLLGSRSNLFTTSCVARETGYCSDGRRIKDLNIRIIGCNHEGKMAGNDCLLTFVDGGNKAGYYVATAQEKFVPDLQKLPWVPIIQFFGRKMCLRNPSEVQRQFAEVDETTQGTPVGGGRGGGTGRGRHGGRI